MHWWTSTAYQESDKTKEQQVNKQNWAFVVVVVVSVLFCLDRIEIQMHRNDHQIHFSNSVRSNDRLWWNNWMPSWNQARRSLLNKSWRDSWPLNGNRCQRQIKKWAKEHNTKICWLICLFVFFLQIYVDMYERSKEKYAAEMSEYNMKK